MSEKEIEKWTNSEALDKRRKKENEQIKEMGQVVLDSNVEETPDRTSDDHW